MKKWAYMAGAFLLGIVVATSAGTVSAKVQSLVGQKVTDEVKIIVNGKELTDKGAVVNGRTNAPVRAIAEAIGGEVSLNGNTVSITTETSVNKETDSSTSSDKSTNKYIGQPKLSLLKIKDGLENDTLKVLDKERKEILAEIEVLKTSGPNGEPAGGLVGKQKDLETYNANVAKYTEELSLVNEALKLLD